nr:hypothetical protein Iba_chr03bCG3200 [Ipomoea batatas]
MSSGLRLLPLSLGAAAAESGSVINGTEPPVPSPVSRRCKATGELRGGSPSGRLQRCGLAVLSTPSNGNGDGSGSEQNGSRRWSVSLLRRSTSVKVMMCRQSNDQPTQQSPAASSTDRSHRCPSPVSRAVQGDGANSAGFSFGLDCSGVDWRCCLLRLTGMATVAEGCGGVRTTPSEVEPCLISLSSASSEQNGSRRWSVSLLRRSTSVKVMMVPAEQPINLR